MGYLSSPDVRFFLDDEDATSVVTEPQPTFTDLRGNDAAVTTAALTEDAAVGATSMKVTAADSPANGALFFGADKSQFYEVTNGGGTADISFVPGLRAAIASAANISYFDNSHDITEFVLSGGDVSRERMIEEDHPFGRAYPIQVDTGVYSAIEITLGGFYRDDATGLSRRLESWFNSADKIQPRWFGRYFKQDGSQRVLFRVIIMSFNRTGESKANSRFEATIKSYGHIYDVSAAAAH